MIANLAGSVERIALALRKLANEEGMSSIGHLPLDATQFTACLRRVLARRPELRAAGRQFLEVIGELDAVKIGVTPQIFAEPPMRGITS